MTGAGLLDQLRAALCRYVVLPSAEAADAVTLWVTATHAVPAWETATRLVITAPEKRCGKSRLLDVIEGTCHRPLMTVNISPAALVRSITDDPPTLLLDEADTVFGGKGGDNHEDLRGLLNAGHQRNRPYIRWDATTRMTERCPTFAMGALAGIGSMPDTITDRAVVIGMRRRAPGEQVAAYRQRRDAAPLRELGTEIAVWVRGSLDALTDAEPDTPVEDRAADNWEPLLAVADLAGGGWPQRARAACVVLSREDDTDTSAGIRLLRDLRDVMHGADSMHGADILDGLHKLDEAPWADWYGSPLDPRTLARLLRPYGVATRDVKIAGTVRKGYRREDLHDAWTRYLDLSATTATSATAQVTGVQPVAGSAPDPLPATGDLPLTRDVAHVAEVADTPRREEPE